MSSSSFYSGSGLTNTQQSAIETIISEAEEARDTALAAIAVVEAAETAATNSATSAASSASSSSTSEANAATSESNAATSATDAATSATNASTSATNASTSATNAATSETNAATSETNAATSASNAATSEANAASSVTSVATSAANAATSEANASNYATNAATSETNAATSASNAATSEANAATSETNAATSATNAATSETNAASSATSAATSETNAATSATSASNYAASAYTSTANATIAKTAAETAKDAAEAALADFNGVYLGALASDPTVDANGDAVNEGDLYFNTVDNELLVYDGTNWVTSGITTVATSSADGLMSSTDKSKLDAIDQALATTDTPTFAGINSGGDIVFEGTTADDFETTLTIEDPTADRTITLPNASGTVPLISVNGLTSRDVLTSFDETSINGVEINPSIGGAGTHQWTIAENQFKVSSAYVQGIAGFTDPTWGRIDLIGNVYLGGSGSFDNYAYLHFNGPIKTDLVFEGSTADYYETTVTITDPTADRTITLPDATGTVAIIDTNDNLSSFNRTTINGVGINPSLPIAGVTKLNLSQSGMEYTGKVYTGPAGQRDSYAQFKALSDVTLGGSDKYVYLDGDIWVDGRLRLEANTDIIFEGATADDYETILTVTDPTADRTITIPDATGQVVLSDGPVGTDASVLIGRGKLGYNGTIADLFSISHEDQGTSLYNIGFGQNTSGYSWINAPTGSDSSLRVNADYILKAEASQITAYQPLYLYTGVDIIFEGAYSTAAETTLTVAEPTVDRTITLPNATGTVAVYSADGISGQVLSTDGSGNLSFVNQVTLNELYSALSGTAVTINCGSANFFSLSTSGNTTFTFSNPPSSGTAYSFTLKITAGGAYTITYPASVDWAGGTAPDAPASGETDLLAFTTYDGGTTWYGFRAGDAMA